MVGPSEFESESSGPEPPRMDQATPRTQEAGRGGPLLRRPYFKVCHLRGVCATSLGARSAVACRAPGRCATENWRVGEQEYAESRMTGQPPSPTGGSRARFAGRG